MMRGQQQQSGERKALSPQEQGGKPGGSGPARLQPLGQLLMFRGYIPLAGILTPRLLSRFYHLSWKN